jgi:hypothetical protein
MKKPFSWNFNGRLRHKLSFFVTDKLFVVMGDCNVCMAVGCHPDNVENGCL